MADAIVSVGLDVGTTTTQLIFSRLLIEDRGGAFSVPELQITDRQILYRSPVHFTPLADESRVDEQGLRELVALEYEKAGIRREDVDTGAVIITGETSRKENAEAALRALSDFAGDFVAATAGPDLESVLAAKGAGAVAYSLQTGRTVLHMDIGGGTANLALIREGKITATGCMNVGGRLLRLSDTGVVTYVSPVLQGLTELQVGATPAPGQLEALAKRLAGALEAAAGLSPADAVFFHLLTRGAETWTPPEGGCVISFSGGVADCILQAHPKGAFGDMGVELGQAIRKSRLCQGDYRLGQETIRATVIGAGSHSAQLSGSTVYWRNVALPLQNLPVAVFDRREQESDDLPQRIAQQVRIADGRVPVLYFPGYTAATYDQVSALAERLTRGAHSPLLVCLEGDMAKALGQKLAILQPDKPCLCIDRVKLTQGSYLDIGKPLGPALPVVVKTLVLETS